MDTAFSLLVGLGLAAACGFRIFVPFLVMSAAATTGHLPLSEGFEWIGTRPALVAFGGFHYLFANFIGAGASALWNFTLNHRFTWSSAV